MKICQPHWTKLRQAIADRGLSDLVAQDGEQAVRNLAAETRDGPSIQTYDPLMAAHNAIMSNALRIAGMVVMYDNEDGTPRCPICYINAEGPAHGVSATYADPWIDWAADGARRQADELLASGKPDA